MNNRSSESDFIGNVQDLPGKISFTFDTWTSEAGDPYLSMTRHYISAPKESPQEWELKSEQLGFKHIEGNHSGANLGGILVWIIDRYGLRLKVSMFNHFIGLYFWTMHARLVGSLQIMLPTTFLPSKKFQGNFKVISLTGILSNITSSMLAVFLREEYWLIRDFEAIWSTRST